MSADDPRITSATDPTTAAVDWSRLNMIGTTADPNALHRPSLTEIFHDAMRRDIVSALTDTGASGASAMLNTSGATVISGGTWYPVADSATWLPLEYTAISAAATLPYLEGGFIGAIVHAPDGQTYTTGRIPTEDEVLRAHDADVRTTIDGRGFIATEFWRTASPVGSAMIHTPPLSREDIRNGYLEDLMREAHAHAAHDLADIATPEDQVTPLAEGHNEERLVAHRVIGMTVNQILGEDPQPTQVYEVGPQPTQEYEATMPDVADDASLTTNRVVSSSYLSEVGNYLPETQPLAFSDHVPMQVLLAYSNAFYSLCLLNNGSENLLRISSLVHDHSLMTPDEFRALGRPHSLVPEYQEILELLPEWEEKCLNGKDEVNE